MESLKIRGQVYWDKMGYIYKTIAKIIPWKLREKIHQFLYYTNLKVDFDSFIGFVLSSSLLIGLVAGFLLSPLFKQPLWVFFLVVVGIMNGIIYLWLILLVDKKAQLIEEALPDALQLMSSNLRARITNDKALLLSSRSEFGPLKEEIDIVGRKVTLGKSVGGALMEMAKKIRSKKLIRAVELINSGLESGGSLANLLEATSNDLREQALIDKKIKAGITMYAIFIFSASSIVTPVLFGLSSFLVDVLKISLANVIIPEAATTSVPITIYQVNISSEYLFFFIITFLVVNSLMGSMLLGMIGRGKKTEGIKYFIPMVLLAIPLFLLSKYVIKMALSGLFGF